ncbi:hypothetical protein ACEPAH_3976 [Sanghuangporus vaninii]
MTCYARDGSSSPRDIIDTLPFPGEMFTPTTRHSPYPAIAPCPSDLTGRIIFVSGASSVLGQAAALALARAGAKGLILTSRAAKLDVLDELEQTILRSRHDNESKIEILKLPMDILSISSIIWAISRVQKTFGSIDTLLNISGNIDSLVPLSTSNPTEWWDALETNVKGTWAITRELLPLIKESKSSTKWIINYTSTSAFYTSPLCSGYSISKLALLRLTEMLCTELTIDFGIDILAVHPGTVATPHTASSVPPSFQHTVIDTPELSAESIVWLVKERRQWLSGRFVSCTWDMNELVQKKEVVENKDLLRMKFSF